MKACFTALRIAGFKSFADPVEVELRPGLTAIIGPNGCGKSNIVEAFRWIMGESSARALRGGDSDDLIFAGTVARPPRNLIEVTLRIENAGGLAAPPHHEDDTLEITRTAKRGIGSDFRINGKSVRAHDITQIFADLSLGGRSLAIVSQNRIGALIDAKPVDRRSLLENAAGISGLHFRRRDAQLKLRQAEANLQRAQDVTQQLMQRRDALKVQSASALAYRSAVETIRETEAQLYAVQWARAQMQIANCETSIKTARERLEEAEKTLHKLFRHREEEANASVECERESEATRNAIETLRIAIEKHRQVIMQSEAGVTRMCELIARSREEKDRLEQRVKMIAADAQTCHETITSLAAQISLIPDEIATCDKSIEAMERDFVAALRSREAQEQDYMRLRIKADTLNRQRHTAEELLTSINNELQDCCRQQVEEAALSPREEDISQLESKIADNERTMTTLQDAIAAQQAALESLNAEVEIAHRRLYTLNQDIEVRSAEYERLEIRSETLDEQIRINAQRRQDASLDLLSEATRKQLELCVEVSRQRVATLREEEASLGQTWRDAGDDLAAQRLNHDTALQQRSFLQRQRESAEISLRALTERTRHAAVRLAAHQADWVSDDAIEEAQAQAQNTQIHLNTCQTAFVSLRDKVEISRASLSKEEDIVLQLGSSLIRHQAERDGILGAKGEDHTSNSLLDMLQIPEPLVAAFGAAFQFGLDAQLNAPHAQRSWEVLPDRDCGSFPSDVTPLSACIEAPDALRIFLSSFGLVSDTASGADLHAILRPGQALVSREGALWRWDGYRQSGLVTSDAAIQLQNKTRFNALNLSIAELDEKLSQATRRRDDSKKNLDEISLHLTEVETECAKLETEYRHCVDRLADLKNRRAQHEALHGLMNSQSTEARRQEQAARMQFEETSEALGRLDDAEGIAARLLHAQETYDDAVQRHETCWNALRAAVKAENQAQQNWEQSKTRHETANARLQDLSHQSAILSAERAEVESRFKESDTTSLRNEQIAAEKASAEGKHKCEAALASLKKMTEENLGVGEAKIELERQLRMLQDCRLSRQSTLAALSERRDILEERLSLAESALRSLPPPLNDAETIACLEASRQREQLLRTQLDALREKKTALTTALQDAQLREETEISRQTFHVEQIKTYQADLARLASDEAHLKEEKRAVVAERLEAAESISPLETKLAETHRTYEMLRARLEKSRQLHVSLGNDINRNESARSEALSAIEISEEKLFQAKASLESLLESPPSRRWNAPLEDVSERAEQSLRRTLSQAVQERDSLGAVNLLAEKEFQDIEVQVATTQENIDEIQAAIERLQTKIAHLNNEGRKRLRATFKDMDAQFQRLFTRVFGGGKANLALVGGDDPLDAGLEIYAQPPGKKLSTLSLLSGGEQALTALSLLFATFACQPAPICVLDEVDAPLDEANTMRLCTLVRDMALQYGVQFMIVTHQQVTMAHMDRLYGVTMQERGVSRLLSVDLSRAMEMAEPIKSD